MKRRNDGKGMWKGLEYKNGIRNRGLRQQLRSETRIKDLRTRWQLRLKSESKSSEFDRKASRLEFVKRANGMSNGFRKIRKWMLWRGRPPPKRKKNLQIRSKSRANVGAPATPGVTAHTVVCV
jgi:hypothetical protein